MTDSAFLSFTGGLESLLPVGVLCMGGVWGFSYCFPTSVLKNMNSLGKTTPRSIKSLCPILNLVSALVEVFGCFSLHLTIHSRMSVIYLLPNSLSPGNKFKPFSFIFFLGSTSRAILSMSWRNWDDDSEEMKVISFLTVNYFAIWVQAKGYHNGVELRARVVWRWSDYIW